MNTRQINYIDPKEDYLDKEVVWALNKTMAERLTEYCRHVIRNCAIAGIDITHYPVKRTIYFIEDEE